MSLFEGLSLVNDSVNTVGLVCEEANHSLEAMLEEAVDRFEEATQAATTELVAGLVAGEAATVSAVGAYAAGEAVNQVAEAAVAGIQAVVLAVAAGVGQAGQSARKGADEVLRVAVAVAVLVATVLHVVLAAVVSVSPSSRRSARTPALAIVRLIDLFTRAADQTGGQGGCVLAGVADTFRRVQGALPGSAGGKPWRPAILQFAQAIRGLGDLAVPLRKVTGVGRLDPEATFGSLERTRQALERLTNLLRRRRYPPSLLAALEQVRSALLEATAALRLRVTLLNQPGYRPRR
jgi:hypothetical protein